MKSATMQFLKELNEKSILICTCIILSATCGCGNPLLIGAQSGDLRKVQSSISSGCDIHTTDSRGATALHIAAENGYNNIVKLLLSNGVEINGKGQVGYSALHMAAANNEVETAQLLLKKGASLELQGKYGETPLWCAVVEKSTRAVEHLLSAGAESNVENSAGIPLLQVAATSGPVSIVDALINDGADLAARDDRKKRTTLHMAAMHDHSDIVRLLIRHGAEVSAVDINGETPLELAKRHGSRNAVKELERLSDFEPRLLEFHTPSSDTPGSLNQAGTEDGEAQLRPRGQPPRH